MRAFRQGDPLRLVPDAEWKPRGVPGMLRLWRSRCFEVTEYTAPEPAVVRLAVHHTTPARGPGLFEDGISWDELQQLKNECGYHTSAAVEIYPAHRELVNTANVRHLWVLQEPPRFAWRVTGEKPSGHYYGTTEP